MRPKQESPTSASEPVLREPGGDIAGWRRQILERAGFASGLASRLSADCGYDLHALIELVERGCPPELAARILAPLVGEGNPC
jgi:hypothetical protein